VKSPLDKTKKKGTEITNGKAHDADKFQTIEPGDDFNIDVGRSEGYEADGIEERDIRQARRSGRTRPFGEENHGNA
jgi:hypothetical protein